MHRNILSLTRSRLFSPSPRSNPSNVDAFSFQEEPINSDFSSKKMSGSGVKSASKKSTPKASGEISTSTRKPKNSILTLPNSGSSNTSEDCEDAIKRKVAKNAGRKKKIRCTEDLNSLRVSNIANHSEVGVKIKSKKTKKSKIRTFLPSVHVFDKDKNVYSSGSSASITDCDKENEIGAEKIVELRRGRSVKTRKINSTKRNSEKSASSVFSENSTTESDDEGEEIDFKESLQTRYGQSPRSKKTILKRSTEQGSHKAQYQDRVVQDTPIDLSKFGPLNNVCPDSVLESNARQSAKKTPRLIREGTFEISSVEPSKLFPESRNNISCANQSSTRETYFVPPRPKNESLRASKKTSVSSNVETIDLTESPSPSKKPKRSTFNKSSLDDNSSSVVFNQQSPSTRLTRNTFNNSSIDKANTSVKTRTASTTAIGSLSGGKSSFEVSFNYNKNRPSNTGILDDLNITRRDSRKSKKSSAGLKHSTGSEEDEIKGSFVTIRRHHYHHTMVDFDTRDSDGEFTNERDFGLRKFKHFDKLNEQGIAEKSICPPEQRSSSDSSQSSIISKSPAKKVSPAEKCILKKSFGRRRDTFEIVESYYENLENDKVPMICAPTADNTPNKMADRDIFDVLARTPSSALEGMMLGSGESLLLDNSFVNQTNLPRWTRTNTLNKDGSSESSQSEQRTSTRKRWSPPKRVPSPDQANVTLTNTKSKSSTKVRSSPLIADLIPKVQKKLNEKELKASKSEKINKSQTNKTILNNTKLHSVTFGVSPTKSKLSIMTSESIDGENTLKGKKSVRIESPLKTPKVKTHPLVVKKTPKPDGNVTDSSILAGNCAYPNTPPSAASTPFTIIKKAKEVSLLKQVLTIEKSKADKSIKGSSSKVKLPNFRKIHERQYEKMENIKELQERKAVRAQYLMSGCKVPAIASISKGVDKEPRKKLMFSPRNTEQSTSTKKVSKPLQHMLKRRASLEKKKKKELKSKLPVLVNFNARKEQPKSPETQKPVVTNVVSKPQRTFPKKVSLEKQKADSILAAKGRSRLGFKVPTNEEPTKEAQIRAVITKSKLAINRTDQNRKKQAVVRTNRRYDLLMQMRANEKK